MVETRSQGRSDMKGDARSNRPRSNTGRFRQLSSSLVGRAKDVAKSSGLFRSVGDLASKFNTLAEKGSSTEKKEPILGDMFERIRERKRIADAIERDIAEVRQNILRSRSPIIDKCSRNKAPITPNGASQGQGGLLSYDSSYHGYNVSLDDNQPEERASGSRSGMGLEPLELDKRVSFRKSNKPFLFNDASQNAIRTERYPLPIGFERKTARTKTSSNPNKETL